MASLVQTSQASMVNAAHEVSALIDEVFVVLNVFVQQAMQAAVAHQQQKQLDDLNRAVMFQRLQQASRPQGPPMGMVSWAMILLYVQSV